MLSNLSVTFVTQPNGFRPRALSHMVWIFLILCGFHRSLLSHFCCSLILYVGEQCTVPVGEVLDDPSRVKLPDFGYADLVSSASFVFASQVPRPIGTSLVHHVSPLPPLVKERRSIIIQDLGVVFVPVLWELVVRADQLVLGKRSCDAGIIQSPKKLNLDLAKNKKEKVVKKSDMEPLCLTYPVSSSVIPCSNAKGKKKVST